MTVLESADLASLFLNAMVFEIGGNLAATNPWNKLGLRDDCLPEEVSWTKKQIGARLHNDKLQYNIHNFMQTRKLLCSPEACSN